MAGKSVTMVVRSSKLGFFRLDDSLIAVDKHAGYCYALNSTGARIWELIASPTNIPSLRDMLCQEFDVEPDACLREVVEILSDMKAAGLVSDWTA